MQRRQFLGRFLGVGVAVGLRPEQLPTITAREASHTPAVSYRGYELHWTGWKPLPDALVLIGQWIGLPRHMPPAADQPIIATAVPGGWTGAYRLGEMVDHYPRVGISPKYISVAAGEEIKAQAVRDGFTRLCRYIDAGLDGTKVDG